jgi:hypothetical protein
MQLGDSGLFSIEHIELVGMVLFPLGIGMGYLVWQQAQMALKVDMMFLWFTNHGSDITGYQPGDEKRKRV